jgi:hypothetical protein
MDVRTSQRFNFRHHATDVLPRLFDNGFGTKGLGGHECGAAIETDRLY